MNIDITYISNIINNIEEISNILDIILDNLEKLLNN